MLFTTWQQWLVKLSRDKSARKVVSASQVKIRCEVQYMRLSVLVLEVTHMSSRDVRTNLPR